MNDDITFENGDYGLRAVLHSAWSNAIEQQLHEKSIAELELNDGKGWCGNDLSFLARFPDLKAFKIIDLKIPSVEPVHCLGELRDLEVITYCKTKLQFPAFPHLENCSLEWRAGAGSVFDCTALKKLFLNRYDGKNTDAFSRLAALESLAILNASVENLHGLGALQKLRSLRLANLKKITSLAGIESLAGLEALEIHTCRGVGSIEEIASLSMLRTLDLNNNGEIASLKPLQNLNLLERVTFYESTNIMDGDLSPLKKQKKLSRIAFKNRRHYTDTSEELRAAHPA